jgi:DNA invertase Pin-like site-specific DNA recombinase
MRVGLYARVSTHDQQTLGLQVEAMRSYVRDRGWTLDREVQDVGSGVKERPQREALLKAVRRREVDAVIVWRLDRWGRSLADLVATLQELSALGVGFVSLTEALDLTTPGGRAMAGLLAVFAEFEREILRERVKAGTTPGPEPESVGDRPATWDRPDFGATYPDRSAVTVARTNRTTHQLPAGGGSVRFHEPIHTTNNRAN